MVEGQGGARKKKKEKVLESASGHKHTVMSLFLWKKLGGGVSSVLC